MFSTNVYNQINYVHVVVNEESNGLVTRDFLKMFFFISHVNIIVLR